MRIRQLQAMLVLNSILLGNLSVLAQTPAPATQNLTPSAPAVPNLTPSTPTVPPATTPAVPSASAVAPVATTSSPLQVPTPTRPTKSFDLRVQSTRKLTIDEAVKIAVDRDPGLLIARLQVEQAKANIALSEAPLYPNLALSATGYTFTQSSRNKFSQIANSSTTSSSSSLPSTGASLGGSSFTSVDVSTFTAGLSSSWTVFSFGRIQSQIESSRQNLRSAELNLAIQTQALKLNVVNNYYSLQQQIGNLRVDESAVRNAQASLRDSQAQEKAGVGTLFSVLQSQVQVANAQQTLLTGRNQVTVAQRNLATSLNFAVPTDITVDEVSQEGTWDLSLEDSIFRALNNRPEFDQLLAQQKSAEALIAANRAALLPSIVLNAGADLFNNINFPNVGFQTGYSLGVGVNWTFFDGGAAEANAQIALRNSQISQVQFLNTSNTVRFGVESAYNTLQTSSEQIPTAKEAQRLAEESLRLSRVRFRAGVGTQTDVITAENALTQAQNNFINAQINYNQALAQLKRALNLL